MCTVSLVPSGGALSVICNRDERHARAAALPPATRRFGNREAILPIDPQGGGTWVAANDAGLVFALLNRTTSVPPPAGLSSRGLVIPSLLASASVADAVIVTASIDPRLYQPFTLVIADTHELAAVTADGADSYVARRPLVLPAMFTSSSLDEARASALRGRLFRRMVVSARDRHEGQGRFHSHQWPEFRALSVRMWRPDARTVSRTQVRISGSNVSFDYAELSAA